MNATGDGFWTHFETLEKRHQLAQCEHETARRRLELRQRERAANLMEAWNRYCEVIAELDKSTAEIEDFRSQTPADLHF